MLLHQSRPDEVFSEEGFSVFIGSAAHAANNKVLVQYNITYVLNVSERIRFKRVSDGPSVVQYHVPLSDYGDSPLRSVLDECFSIINEARSNRCNILVHCQRGVNRSPTIVIAYLMYTFHWGLKKAWEHVKESRSMASPHEHYMQQLIDCEIELFGRSTIDFKDYEQNSIQGQLRKIRLQYAQQQTTNDSSSLGSTLQISQEKPTQEKHTQEKPQLTIRLDCMPLTETKKPQPSSSTSTSILPSSSSPPPRAQTPPFPMQPTRSHSPDSPARHSPKYQWSPPQSPKFLSLFGPNKEEKFGFDCILCEGNAFS